MLNPKTSELKAQETCEASAEAVIWAAENVKVMILKVLKDTDEEQVNQKTICMNLNIYWEPSLS